VALTYFVVILRCAWDFTDIQAKVMNPLLQ